MPNKADPPPRYTYMHISKHVYVYMRACVFKSAQGDARWLKNKQINSNI